MCETCWTIVCCEGPTWVGYTPGYINIYIPSPDEVAIERYNRLERKRLRYHRHGRVCRFFYAILLLSGTYVYTYSTNATISGS